MLACLPCPSPISDRPLPTSLSHLRTNPKAKNQSFPAGGKDGPTVIFSLSEATKRIMDAHQKARSGRSGKKQYAGVSMTMSEGQVGMGGGQLVWLKGGSVYEVVGLYKMVRHFCDEATGLAIVSFKPLSRHVATRTSTHSPSVRHLLIA